MKRVFNRGCVLALALTLGLMFGGCVKLKQAWTINPDGSGKVTVTIAVNEAMLNQEGVPDPFADLDNPVGLMGGANDGWVAFTRPVITVQGGFKTATFIGYFEDISQVNYRADGGMGRMRSTDYTFANGSLTAENTMLAQVIDTVSHDPSMADASYRASLAPNFEGLEMVESYTLPGEITDAEGFAVAGRTATAAVTAESLITHFPPTIAGLDDGELVLTFTPAGWPEGGEAAWNNELTQAKADWKILREQTLETTDIFTP